jgi:hypothetical protein
MNFATAKTLWAEIGLVDCGDIERSTPLRFKGVRAYDANAFQTFALRGHIRAPSPLSRGDGVSFLWISLFVYHCGDPQSSKRTKARM